MTATLYEFDAIGTHWWCEILHQSGTFGNKLMADINAACQQFDARYSRFREDSLVAELSRTGSIGHPPAEFICMLDFAKKMEYDTDGAFTISVGASLHTLGYGDTRRASPPVSDPWKHIRYNQQVVKIPKGLMLDFGGQGKGWLIDTIAGILRAHGIREFIVNGGGDLYVTSTVPIEFALEDPYDPSLKIGQTMITRGALAGSSSMKRTWERDGHIYHHIIDPATHLPSKSNIVASFVKADSALVADAIATVLMVRPELEAQLVAAYDAQVITVPKRETDVAE